MLISTDELLLLQSRLQIAVLHGRLSHEKLPLWTQVVETALLDVDHVLDPVVSRRDMDEELGLQVVHLGAQLVCKRARVVRLLLNLVM